MPLEPRQPFLLSLGREGGDAAFPAEPVLSSAPPDGADAPSDKPAALSRAPRRIGQGSGLSGLGHVMVIAALLVWGSHVVPPRALDPGAAVAMLFQPTTPSPATPSPGKPALPPMEAVAPVPPDSAPPTALQPPEAEPATLPATPLAEARPSPPAPPTLALTPTPTLLAAPPVALPARPPPSTKAAPRPLRQAKAAPASPPRAPAHASAAPEAPPASAPQTPATTAANASSSQTALLQPLVPPRPLAAAAGNPAPLYPMMAERRREQGRVLLHVDVSADGQARAVKIAVSSGFSILDRAAMEAVQQWRFVPASRGGVPVAAVAEVPVQFTLSN